MTEQQKILKLLEDKKITADEAARLLDAVGGDPAGGARPKFLKVRVYDRTTGKSKVNVVVPVALIRWGMQFVPESAQMKLDERNISLEQISKALDMNYSGMLVNVEDDEDNEKVEVYLE